MRWPPPSNRGAAFHCERQGSGDRPPVGAGLGIEAEGAGARPEFSPLAGARPGKSPLGGVRLEGSPLAVGFGRGGFGKYRTRLLWSGCHTFGPTMGVVSK